MGSHYLNTSSLYNSNGLLFQLEFLLSLNGVPLSLPDSSSQASL